jgi:lipopolysaccharide export system protein LptA
MRGDNIDLDFTAESGLLTHARLDTGAVLTLRDDAGVTQVKSNAIDFYVGANGETLTKLEATGPTETILPRVGESPARTIHSGGLVAEGQDPKGLDRAVFSGGIQYREALPAAPNQAAAVRLAASQSLVLNLDGGLNQVKDANFRQAFCFVGPLAPAAPPLDAKCSTAKTLPARTMDDTMAAAADEGTYDAKAETLRLRSTAPTRPRPWVVNREVTVEGREIDMDIKQNAIDARGSVKEQVDFNRKPTPAQVKESGTGLFENDKAITVKTTTLKYSKDTGRATYTGDVFMFQPASAGQAEGSVLKADKVDVDDQKHDIIATGNVRSTFFIEQAPDEPGKQGPTRTTLNANAMTYFEAKRTAVYTGAAVMETGEGATRQKLEAAEITLVMQAQKRALKSLIGTASGTGIVLAKLPEGRQAKGLRLAYDADKDVYVMTGKPAVFVARSTTNAPGMCQVGTGSRIDFPRSGGEASVTAEGGGVGRLDEKRCAEVIK